MPNWVKNKVRAVNKADTQKLIAMLVRKDNDGNDVTNFNGIIPMPEELRNTTAGYGDPKWEEEHKRCMERYGFKDWYDFACARWGTKWDNNAVYIVQGSVIEFQTAWSMPDGIYQKIAETIPIVVAYADEDIGVNYGIVQYENGIYSDIEVCGTDCQIANAIWGNEYNEGECDYDPSYKDNYSDDAVEDVNAIIYR